MRVLSILAVSLVASACSPAKVPVSGPSRGTQYHGTSRMNGERSPSTTADSNASIGHPTSQAEGSFFVPTSDCWVPLGLPPVEQSIADRGCAYVPRSETETPVVRSIEGASYIVMRVPALDGTKIGVRVGFPRMMWSQTAHVRESCAVVGPLRSLPGKRPDEHASAEITIRSMPSRNQPLEVQDWLRRPPSGWNARASDDSPGTCSHCYVTFDRCWERTYDISGTAGNFVVTMQE